MLFANNPERLAREFKLEACRAQRFRSCISRLRGMYVFDDQDSARRATEWGASFRAENLTDLSLAEARVGETRFDANWISYAPPSLANGSDIPEWMDRYWGGEPHPEHEPIWEVLAEGRLVLLGTALRNQAFDRVRSAFPDALVLLETARLAAWLGYDLGNVAAFLGIDGVNARLSYLIDMREANDPVLLRRMGDLRDSGHPINWDAIGPLLQVGEFILPDLRPYGFVRPLADMPYLGALGDMLFR